MAGKNATLSHQTQLCANRSGGVDVITGNHLDLNTGLLTLFYSSNRFCTWRVGHSDDTQ